MSSGRLGVLLAGVTIFAMALRTVMIGHESVWIDEAVSLHLAASPIRDLVTGVARDDGNPWGYWVILAIWQGLFGPTIESARLLSATLGSLIAPVTFLLARAEGSNRTMALFAALATAVSPPLVFLGREARVYAIFAVVATLAGLTMAAIRRGQRFAYPSFVLLGITLLYLHYYAFFVLGALALSFVWGRRPSAREFVRIGSTYLMVALAFLPAVPLFIKQLGAGTTRSEGTWLLHLGAFPLFSVAGHTLVWKRTDPLLFVSVFVVVVAAIMLPALYGLFRSRKAPLISTTLVLGTLALVVLASLRSPILNSRYLSVVVPAAMVVLVVGIGALFKYRPRLAAMAAALTAITISASLFRLYTSPHLPDWRGVARVVSEAGSTLPVFFYDDTGKLPFTYYRPEQVRYTITAPFSVSNWTKQGVFALMAAQPQGFWIALYLPYARPKELDEVTGYLSARFRVEHVQDFLGIRLVRVGPAA